MRHIDAEVLAIKLMDQHGLINLGWRFEFDDSKRRFGVCKHHQKVIGLSRSLTYLNQEHIVKNTILHEIAHALVGFKHGHDKVWVSKAKEIGCDGQRCYSSTSVVVPTGKYVAYCPKCNKQHNKYRKPKRVVSCGHCSRSFNKDAILNFKMV